MLGVANAEVDLARPVAGLFAMDVEDIVRRPASRRVGLFRVDESQSHNSVTQFTGIDELEMIISTSHFLLRLHTSDHCSRRNLRQRMIRADERLWASTRNMDSSRGNAKNARIAGRGMENSREKAVRIARGLTVSLCVVALVLVFLLPAESLIVDLVYQQF